jgi:hypothetical protein
MPDTFASTEGWALPLRPSPLGWTMGSVSGETLVSSGAVASARIDTTRTGFAPWDLRSTGKDEFVKTQSCKNDFACL